MPEFKELKQAVKIQFDKLSQYDLFIVDVDKNELWDTYLQSFPEGTNPIYKERTEHDCQCCKQFIRTIGGVVSIVDGEIVSIWDLEVAGFYQIIADKLSKYVKSKTIKDVFLHYEKDAGTDKNLQLVDETTITWRHLHCDIPSKHVKRKDNIPTMLSDMRSNFDVLKRSLEEITLDSAETVLELIDQNSLYRGKEHEGIVTLFVRIKKEFDLLSDDKKALYCWPKSLELKGASKIRNTVIGSLLTDLSEGKELDIAVKSFEAKVAPTNYKRPTALITKSMIAKAQTKVSELGFESALDRRFAITEDITINNVLFADRSVKKAMNVFDELSEEVPANTKSLDKVEEVNINDFIENILPKADGIELLMENKHTSNLMSLIAPNQLDSKNMLKWDNNFSWSYEGEVTDSIKERVKNAGGNVTGDLRCSLAWYTSGDLDLHLKTPQGHIYYSNMQVGKGILDVDNTRGGTPKEPAVENITYDKRSMMIEGNYELLVHNFSSYSANSTGFDVEFDFMGDLLSFHYANNMRSKEFVSCVKFSYSHAEGIKVISSLPSSKASKDIWNIKTETFNKVCMIMNSPNHWDGNQTGNKHWFFILDKCNSGKKGRGFFNEFLNEDLREHRKVFEVLGAKLKVEESDNQLSGLGFSSTQRNHAYFKVSGKFSRTIKVIF